MQPQHILIVLPNLEVGGAEKLSVDLAEQFVAKGIKVTFALMKARGDLMQRAGDCAEIIDLQITRSLDLIRNLPSIIRTRSPDAVIANIWPVTIASALAVRRIRRSIRPRLMLVEHNPLSIQYRGWGLKTRLGLVVSQALAARLADLTVGVSHGVVDDLAKLSQLPKSHFEVIHNPVTIAARPNATSIRFTETVWGSGVGRKLLTVGSLKQQKNHILAVDAFASMRQKDDHLIILGEGPMRSKIEAHVASLGLSDAISMPGFMDSPAAFYNTADLFILSSDYEGFGNVIVEALGAGLNVVSTDCPSGPAEILKDGVYGTLVTTNNAEAFGRAIEKALACPKDPLFLRSRAEDFTPNIIADHYLSALSRLAGMD